ncbi:MAG: HAMP domain-containing sensor histidine kinase [Eubacteriales bacterium]
MFKSIFQKIFVTYLSILILVMIVLTVTISSLADNYVYNEKKGVLQSVAYKTNSIANDYSNGEISNSQLTELIDSMGYITDTKIYIVKTDDSGNISLGDELGDDYLRNAIDKVLEGEEVFLVRQYSKGFEAQMLVEAYPWADSSGIKGAILLFSPEKEISSIVSNIRIIILLTAAAFVLIGGFIIYLFSKRIVRPIKEIDTASRKMSEGEQVEDIKIRSKDELGSLASSFNSMKGKLIKNEELRQNLIANISHDLRTPITSINGFISGMYDGVIKPEDYLKYIGIIRQETKRLISLTGEILETAKIQSGNIELNKNTFNLRRIVDNAVKANKQIAIDKQIKIVTNVSKDIKLHADAKKIEQILYNLINNSIKYSDENSIVTVNAEQFKDKIKVSVKDTGAGIPPEDIPHIFDRYFRADVTKGKDGFGLGLCIVKTYVEAHGGHLEVKSKVGEGTQISFEIPAL